jgi:hypothetical protein
MCRQLRGRVPLFVYAVICLTGRMENMRAAISCGDADSIDRLFGELHYRRISSGETGRNTESCSHSQGTSGRFRYDEATGTPIVEMEATLRSCCHPGSGRERAAAATSCYETYPRKNFHGIGRLSRMRTQIFPVRESLFGVPFPEPLKPVSARAGKSADKAKRRRNCSRRRNGTRMKRRGDGSHRQRRRSTGHCNPNTALRPSRSDPSPSRPNSRRRSPLTR